MNFLLDIKDESPMFRKGKRDFEQWYHWPSREFAARELYNLKTDPKKNFTVAELPAHKKAVKEMAARLKAGWRATLPAK